MLYIHVCPLHIPAIPCYLSIHVGAAVGLMPVAMDGYASRLRHLCLALSQVFLWSASRLSRIHRVIDDVEDVLCIPHLADRHTTMIDTYWAQIPYM
jgi:hypothetical protein